ncbi:hypothetical protein [Actinotalea caeni]|uniref:hypothetical protein n=1 Tax=Actinotalea caeni TaxID=1348467 RepID=UPI0012E0D5FB|nr:hypothetical protein [Actinotalea caeni]
MAASTEGLALTCQVEPDLQVNAAGYRAEVAGGVDALRARPYVDIHDTAGRRWLRLCLLAGADSADVRDETWLVETATLAHEAGAVLLRVELASTAWEHKEVELRLTPTGVELQLHLTGTGRLGRVTLGGGTGALPTGASGLFRSGYDAGVLAVPVPTEPVAFLRSPHLPAQLGVVGDADPGRLHGIFSPPPLVLTLGRGEVASPVQSPPGDWLALQLRAAPTDCGFTQVRWSPMDGGTLLELDHEEQTVVDGAWSSPVLVVRPVAGPAAAVRDHAADLVAHGMAPAGPPRPARAWWHEPLFCGWGAQVEQGDAARRSARSTYDTWLAALADAGLHPGTVVVDDRWEETYGSGVPDPDRWPDMRAWVAAQHDAGRRVLLWWKCWDPSAAPVEECITTPDGAPLAVDPASPAYRARLRTLVAAMLGPEGLDADGLKVDFSQRAPSGATLRRAPDADSDAWGVAALHLLLRELYDAAVAAKPDALVVTHAVHPGFGDCADMIRTNDVLERDLRGRPVPVADQLRSRTAIVRAALPRHLVDTDQWPMPSRDEWLAYADAQVDLGVPALYYVDTVQGEPVTTDDLHAVAAGWRRYRERVAR